MPDQASGSSSKGQSDELAALPPIADLVSREVRRMGRAWKIEAIKSLLHVVLTMLVIAVLVAGWLIFLGTFVLLGLSLWRRFKLKATVKPYRFLKRGSAGSHDVLPTANEVDYADWLLDGTDTK